MKRVRLTALVEFDIMEAQDFYLRSGEWVVAHFMESVDEAIRKLSGLAGMHPIVYGYHRMRVPHFPFSVYYDVEGDSVVVHAVLDDRFGPARITAHFGFREK